MSTILYDAHPSLWRSRPFAMLINLTLIVLGGLLFLFAAEAVAWLALPADVATAENIALLSWIGLGVSGFALLQLLAWWLGSVADRLAIKSDEMIWTHGLLNRQYTEINLASVRTVRVTQSLFQRIMGVGDIAVYTAGDQPELVVHGLPHPHRIRDLVKGQ